MKKTHTANVDRISIVGSSPIFCAKIAKVA